MGEIDFEVLSDYSDEKAFMKQLSLAESSLQGSQSKQFFKIILSHFAISTPEKIGVSILKTLYCILSQKKHLTRFTNGTFIQDLPYKQKDLTEPLFDLLFLIAKSAPETFGESISSSISRLSIRNPKKFLILLSIVSQGLNDDENTWNVIDLLLDCDQYLTNDDCIVDYVYLIGYLIGKYSIFQERAKICFKVVTNILKKAQRKDLIQACYSSMSRIAVVEKDISIPISTIKTHIENSNVQEAALTFLLVSPILEEINLKFLKCLLRISQDNETAALVLMRFAESEIISEMLSKYTRWMGAELPTPESTIKLFLIVFNHKNLRKDISRSEDFPILIQMAIEMQDPLILSMICTVLRRIDIDEEVVSTLASEGILTAFMEASESIGSDEAIFDALLLASTLAGVGYTPVLRGVCDLICDIAKKGGSNFAPAIGLARDLLKYPKCEGVMRSRSLGRILMQSRWANKSVVKEVISVLS